MTGKLVSIDPGDRYIKLVTGKRKGNILTIDKVVSVPVRDGVLKDGKIEDIYSMKEIINDTFDKYGIKARKVILTLESTSIITRELILPSLKHDEMSTMVKYEIEQYLPIVASEYVIDYTFIEEFEEDKVKKSKVRVAAMPKSMVENYYNLIRESGLKPVALDIHSNAVSKLFLCNAVINNDNEISGKTIAMVDLGHQSINVHILTGGKLNFSRIISLGGRDIDMDIALDYGIPIEEAEIKKIESGCLGTAHEGQQQDEEIINDILRSKVDVWISEIQKIFQYYISRFIGNRIDDIYLFGGSSCINGIVEYIERATNIKTHKIQTVSIVKFGRDTDNVDIARYINALGGMIRYD